jgi:arylsulfatase
VRSPRGRGLGRGARGEGQGGWREEAEYEGVGYPQWYLERMFAIAPAAYVGQWLQSFREFPPRQKPGSFNLDRVMEAVTKGASDK